MNKRTRITSACIIAGCALILTALGLIVFTQIVISRSRAEAESVSSIIFDSISEPHAAIKQTKEETAMSALSIDNRDYVGVIELPSHSSALPVAAEAESLSLLPYVYSGSIYAQAMVLYASSQRGQLDFYKEISVYDAVYFTDMTGSRYSFTVANILYRSEINDEMLSECESPLIIITEGQNANEYVLICCDI